MRKTALAKYPVYLLNVVSVAVYMPGHLMAVYYATKAYVRNFTRALAFENKDRSHVHISCLCSGPTDTNFLKAASLDDSGLFKILKPMTAKVVAEAGFKGLKVGHRVIIPRFFNKIMFLHRVMPQIV